MAKGYSARRGFSNGSGQMLKGGKSKQSDNTSSAKSGGGEGKS